MAVTLRKTDSNTTSWVAPTIPPEIWDQIIRYIDTVAVETIFDKIPLVAQVCKNSKRAWNELSKKQIMHDITPNIVVRALNLEKPIKSEELFNRASFLKKGLIWDFTNVSFRPPLPKNSSGEYFDGPNRYCYATRNERGEVISNFNVESTFNSNLDYLGYKVSPRKVSPRLDKRIEKFISPDDKGEKKLAVVYFYFALKNQNFSKAFKFAVKLGLSHDYLDHLAKLNDHNDWLSMVVSNIRNGDDVDAILNWKGQNALQLAIENGDEGKAKELRELGASLLVIQIENGSELLERLDRGASTSL